MITSRPRRVIDTDSMMAWAESYMRSENLRREKGMQKPRIVKWQGDDRNSYAVFLDGQSEPVVSGLSREQAEYHKRRIWEKIKEREHD